jgi:nitroreductase
MDVTEAIRQRRSVRAFLDTPVATQTITAALETAARAPSGGNVQPWKIYVLNGEKMDEFRALMERRLAGEAFPGGEEREYDVYPDKLKEPYRTARFQVGEEMYGHLGIPREDRDSRLKWFAQNYRFFGAPAAIFCFFDRQMGPPQWSDCGMFLQSFMLLMTEAGLSTCAQECWYNYPKTVAGFCNAPEELMLFCGIAIGHEDTEHPVNRLRSQRLETGQWLTVL